MTSDELAEKRINHKIEQQLAYPILEDIVKDTVLARYKALRHDKTSTAISLGISRATVYRMLNKWGVL